MGLTIYDKSSKYGDLHEGYAVTAAICEMSKLIDPRNPAVVKFARLILGNDDAVRDSIDDIATYARMSMGSLTFNPARVSAKTQAVVMCVAEHRRTFALLPTAMAYVCAYYGCVSRDSKMAYEVLAEYAEYLYSNCADSTSNDSQILSLIAGARRIKAAIERLPASPQQPGEKDEPYKTNGTN